ncbi:STAS domain-containing protein [Actinoplanes sp. CA-030573]|uniref:STAS domain-containing protein n=1 Tax=Actinoplanes sp. CA-030573 TaxID=3239898 RepID=UPI003D8E6C26
MDIAFYDDGGGGTRLVIDGELDMATAGDLDQQVGATLERGPLDRLIVDLANLRFCDTSGIYALLRARESALRHGAAFQVVNVVGITRRSLEITGLLQVLSAVGAAPAQRPSP